MPDFRWRRLNTISPSYVSIYPPGMWHIRKLANKRWQLRQARKDGDEYIAVSAHATVQLAKQAAQDWSPE